MRGEQIPHVLAGTDLEPQVDARMAGQEGRERGGQDVLARGGYRGEAHPAALWVQVPARGGECLLVQPENRPGITGEGMACRGQPEPPAFPLDQGRPDLPGQGGDGSGNGGLGDDQASGGGPA